MSKTSQSSAQSLSKKLRVYCLNANKNSLPEGFAQFATSSSTLEHGVIFLRGLSKEVDRWVTELLTPEQQDEMVLRMRFSGVLDSDLPITKRTREIKRLMRLKRKYREDEKIQIRDAAKNWNMTSLSASEVNAVLDRISNIDE